MKHTAHVFLGTSIINKREGTYVAHVLCGDDCANVISEKAICFNRNSAINSYYLTLYSIYEVSKKISVITNDIDVVFYIDNYEVANDYENKMFDNYKNVWKDIKSLKLNINIKYKNKLIKNVNRRIK